MVVLPPDRRHKFRTGKNLSGRLAEKTRLPDLEDSTLPSGPAQCMVARAPDRRGRAEKRRARVYFVPFCWYTAARFPF
jgi:hypothetical protein